MTSPEYKWVTIERFWTSGPALFIKNVLEGNGIPAFVRNEYMGGLFAHLSMRGAEGGIELQVPSDLVDEAREVLLGIECGNGESELADDIEDPAPDES